MSKPSLALAVLIAASLCTAQATVVAYTSRTAWAAAVSGITAIDIEDIDPTRRLYVFDAGHAPGQTNGGSRGRS